MEAADTSHGPTFLVAYNELLSATGNDPASLTENWEGNERLIALCTTLYETSRSIEIVEEYSSVALTPNVLPAGIKARRDYDTRWSRPVAHVALMQHEIHRIMEEIFSKMLDEGFSKDEAVGDPLGLEIDAAQQRSRSDARSVCAIFEATQEQLDNDEFGDWEWAEEGLNAWTRLTKVCEFDVAGALWRRSLVPHVLIPQHVSRHYGEKKASLYRRWHEASRAFVFGAPRAALAMQRAVLEEMLKVHWAADGGHVKNANLPTLAMDRKASRLKRLANDALHGDPDMLTSRELDRKVIENFGLLQTIIEQAPLPA